MMASIGLSCGSVEPLVSMTITPMRQCWAGVEPHESVNFAGDGLLVLARVRHCPKCRAESDGKTRQGLQVCG